MASDHVSPGSEGPTTSVPRADDLAGAASTRDGGAFPPLPVFHRDELVAGRFRSSASSARAAWARSTKPRTRSSVDASRSRPSTANRRRPADSRALQARDPAGAQGDAPERLPHLRPVIITSDPSPTRDVAFLTMELLPGETLAERLAARRAAARRRGAAARRARWPRRSTPRTRPASCTATSRAPTSCSCLDGRPRGVRAVVTDFGLARRARGDAARDLTLTGDRGRRRDAGYMAPEQVEGQRADGGRATSTRSAS